MIRIFIGYDDREAVAYHVCVNSIVRRSTEPVSITPLVLSSLEGYRETHADASNEFVYSRFLVPSLMNYHDWALFIDGDMILREDISKLWALRDESKAVLCVKHDYKTTASIKFLGSQNKNYQRKNWSSVILWNCAHPANRAVTPEFVMKSTGQQLHRFSWLDDDLIGELPIEWNWLPDEFGANDDAKLLHFTLGTPCFDEYANSPMADEWQRERAFMENCDQAG